MLTNRTTTSARPTSPDSALTPVPWWPVLGLSGVLVTLLLALSARHGYHLDELYTRVAGRHLSWAQIDQPPLPAFVAWLETTLFGDTLVAFRLVPALTVAGVVVLACLIARELGGGRRAQVLATAAAAGSGLIFHTGHMLGTNTFDLPAWVAVCWLAIRLARTENPRLWFAIGAVVGLGLYAKYLIALLLIALAVGLLLCGPRRLLLSRYPVFAAVIAVVLPAPVLVWQMTHGWPQFEMAAAISKALENLAVVSFLPFLVLLIGLFLVPVWIAGLIGLLRRPQWRQYRFVGVAFPVMIALLLVTGVGSNYASGLQFVLLAAGCVVVEGWSRTVTLRSLVTAAVAANTVTSAVLALPVLPLDVYAGNPVLEQLSIGQLDQAAWPELAAQAAAVYRSLPAEERAHTVFYGNHYGQAGALDKYGPEYGLPQAYSGHNSYADFGVPSEDKTVVIAIGVDRTVFAGLFASCEPHGKFQVDLPVDDRGQEFLVCRGPREPWSQIWPKLRWIGFQCPYTTKPVTAKSETGCE
ncbi:glycosyltransferase family 39 protein [Amycolatopsis sp. RTGN1]|uniref:glycosyltransferase family 39 protein n=1 Tax=Amycolatopsis ponsaeliensis TaxID=2992142 RepID=UPI00254C5795|nr:glycosyltransferase family 39 protein [Amycolatopsis sp. RTGN1]